MNAPPPVRAPEKRAQVWLRGYAKVLALATLSLIFIGGLVTSTRSGLSVPDWPTTYGHGMFSYPLSEMVGGILYEHGHRLVASGVGLMTLIMALWLPMVEKRSWLRVLGFASLSAVFLQGLLGGLTVLLGLPTAISVAHGVLAQTFFCMTMVLAYGLSVERRRRVAGEISMGASPALVRAAAAVVVFIFLQLLAGALMRHSHSGLAIPDFPRSGGTWIPLFDQAMLDRVNAQLSAIGYTGVTLGQMWTHGAHRAGAVLVTIAVLVLGYRARREKNLARPLARSIYLLLGLLLVQITLAAFTIWTRKEPWITSAHVVTGAAMLGWAVLILLRAIPVRAGEPAGHPSTSSVPVAVAWPLPDRATLGAFLELAKPRIVSMVLITTGIGYFLGGSGIPGWGHLLMTLVGTGLAAGGAAALNNYLERETDTRMQRTRQRVLPSGRMEPGLALTYGVTLVLGGVSLLVWSVNLLAGFLVLLTAFLYVLVYTPLKRITWLNTPIGAIPGALPPMVGWAAATGELSAGAWILFGILYTWQHPHFYAIAWMFREDYRAAGFQMLSVVDPSGRRLFRQAIIFSVALLAVSVSLTALGITGRLYLVGSLLIGIGMLASSLMLARQPTLREARRVLLTSVIYLPILLVLIVLDAGWARFFPTLGN
jgi:protoheme IX farnesyltransferase